MIDKPPEQVLPPPTRFRLYAEAALGPAILLFGARVDPVTALWLRRPADDLMSARFFPLAVLAGGMVGGIWAVIEHKRFRADALDGIAARLRGKWFALLAVVTLPALIAAGVAAGACRPFMMIGGVVIGFIGAARLVPSVDGVGPFETRDCGRIDIPSGARAPYVTRD